MKRVIASLLITLGLVFTLGAFEQHNLGLLILFGLMGFSMVFIGAGIISNE